jgi:tetratricopeptide (TPR) repeat protein
MRIIVRLLNAFPKALLALLVANVGCSDSKETRIQRLLLQGNEMIEQKNYEQAERYYQGAVALDSCFADAWNNLGTVEYTRGNLDGAAAKYSRAIECNPDLMEAYLNRANTYYESGEVYNALKDLDRVEKQLPDTTTLHLLRGLVFTRMKRYAEAKHSFKKGLSKDPANSDLMVNIGNILYFERDYDSARLYLGKLVDEGITQPNAYNTLALIEAETGNYPIALRHISKALELDPSNAYFLNNRGYIRLLMGEAISALQDINESITLDPYNPWAYRNKGILSFEAKDLNEALRLLKHAETIDPTITDLNYYLGEVYWASNEKSMACNYFAKSRSANDRLKPAVSKRCPA